MLLRPSRFNMCRSFRVERHIRSSHTNTRANNEENENLNAYTWVNRKIILFFRYLYFCVSQSQLSLEQQIVNTFSSLRSYEIILTLRIKNILTGKI